MNERGVQFHARALKCHTFRTNSAIEFWQTLVIFSCTYRGWFSLPLEAKLVRSILDSHLKSEKIISSPEKTWRLECLYNTFMFYFAGITRFRFNSMAYKYCEGKSSYILLGSIKCKNVEKSETSYNLYILFEETSFLAKTCLVATCQPSLTTTSR